MAHDGVRPGCAQPLALRTPERQLESEEVSEGAVAVGADDCPYSSKESAEEEGRGDTNIGRRGEAKVSKQAKGVSAGRKGGVMGGEDRSDFASKYEPPCIL